MVMRAEARGEVEYREGNQSGRSRVEIQASSLGSACKDFYYRATKEPRQSEARTRCNNREVGRIRTLVSGINRDGYIRAFLISLLAGSIKMWYIQLHHLDGADIILLTRAYVSRSCMIRCSHGLE